MPQVVLVGPEGSCKTCLVELITGCQLPKGKTFATFCPLEFNLIRSYKHSAMHCRVSISEHWDPRTKKYRKHCQSIKVFETEDAGELYDEILKAQQRCMKTLDKETQLTRSAVQVDIWWNAIEDLRFVDLPGFRPYFQNQKRYQMLNVREISFFLVPTL